jgi:hypothetical protein
MSKQKVKSEAITEETVFRKIYLIRGHKVMLDADLAELYEVETKVLKRSVRRNIERFPDDFMFELTQEEWDSLRCQIGTSNDKVSLRSQFVTLSNEPSRSQIGTLNDESLRSQIASSNVLTPKRGGQRYLPFAFTEQGVSMLSTVLRSQRAIEVNIGIMRIFVKMRQMISGYKELLEKVEKMESTQLNHDEDIENIYSIIKELLEPAIKDRTPIGYKTSKPKK